MYKLLKSIYPEIDYINLTEELNKTFFSNPPPVVWLLGKTQSGKTSIVRSLTGNPDAEIGSGFQSCTRTAKYYDFPSEAPVVRFLDTQGLGEVAYDPAEDIAFCESQAQLVITVVKAADVLQDEVFSILRTVRDRHPDWPVIIAQTCLHELYPSGTAHIQPYPFDAPGWRQSVPSDLCRCLLAQRDYLGQLPGNGPFLWVPIDLTLPEDGITPEDYGLESLWKAIETASSIGLHDRLRGDSGLRDAFARAGYLLGASRLVLTRFSCTNRRILIDLCHHVLLILPQRGCVY